MRPDVRSAGHAKHFHYRATVDGLRGVAVLAVLGFHAFPERVSGGYVGVDVFFVISGFLITSIIARQLLHQDFSFADFYWRRVRRLFPALVLVLAATSSLGWLVLLPDEFKQLGKHVSAAAAFVANFAFWRESGYFDTAAEFKPLLHLWSLGIEEQFYLVWPAVVVVFWKRRMTLVIVLSALMIASFASSVALGNTAPVANFYLPVSRFWELGVGCLLALVMERTKQRREESSPEEQRFLNVGYNILPVAGLALIMASIAEFDTTTPFPSWPTLLPVLGTLLILATPEHAWFLRHVLGSAALVWTGLISYALYLWHWPLLSFLNILEAGAPSTAMRCLALALSFVLAGLTYHFVEVPIRRHKNPRLNLRLAASAAVAGMAGATVYAAGGVAQRFDVDVQALRNGPRRDELCLDRFDANVPINYCRATSAQPPAILFVGDSKAHAIYESAASLLAPKHSVMLLGRGGCPPLLNVHISSYDLNDRECMEVWRTFVRYVHETRPKVVVVVGNGSFLITRPEIRLARAGSTAPESKQSVVEYGIRTLLTELTQSSRVIYVKEIPGFTTAPSCFLRPVRLPTTDCHPERDRQQIEVAMAPYEQVIDRVQAALPEVHVIDPVDILCAENVCSQRPQGKPILYSDALHLSPAGARLLVESAGLPGLISRNIRTAEAG